jgi:hypothetical protein
MMALLGDDGLVASKTSSYHFDHRSNTEMAETPNIPPQSI